MTYLETLSDRLNFGKFTDSTLGEVLMYNESYIRWVIRNVDGSICAITDSAMDEINLIFPQFMLSDKEESLRKQRLCEWENVWGYTDNEEEECSFEESGSFGKYSGSYAQDVMGYSDDDIDIIFDGDPDAYWNID